MTILRLLHIVVVAVLVLAAADVYEIKFGSTLEAQQVAKMRAEIRRERDAIAALRDQWTKLDNPERIEALTRRHLPLKPIEVYQIAYNIIYQAAARHFLIEAAKANAGVVTMRTMTLMVRTGTPKKWS